MTSPATHRGRFWHDQQGSITILFVILLPILLLVGGLATDAVRLNAQKRYVQSQADLAAQSAARALPDIAKARQIARDVVAENRLYGRIILPDSRLVIGHMGPNGNFIADPNQVNPSQATAIKVLVPSPYRAFLLGPVLNEQNVTILRSAAAGQEAVVVFLLRNRLLGLNTRDAILGPVLNALGLGLNLSLLDYRGLLGTNVRLDRLLALLSLGLDLDALTFNDVLRLPVTMPVLFAGLVQAGGWPAGANAPNPPAGNVVRLADIMNVSPKLLNLRLRDILPDLTINAADLVTAFLGLSASPSQRIGANVGLDLRPLANVSLSLGLIRPPVIAIGRLGDVPAPSAEVSQADIALDANVLQSPSAAPGAANPALLSLRANIGVGTASARIDSLNCAARNDTDVLASFTVQTAPIALALRLGVLDSRAEPRAPELQRTDIARRSQNVTVTFGNFRTKTPVPVRNPLTVSGLVADLGESLRRTATDILDQISSNACAAGLLSALLCPLITWINTALAAVLNALSALTNVLASFISALGVDLLVQAVLDLLGIGLAQADLILDDYSCSSKLHQ